MCYKKYFVFGWNFSIHVSGLVFLFSSSSLNCQMADLVVAITCFNLTCFVFPPTLHKGLPVVVENVPGFRRFSVLCPCVRRLLLYQQGRSSHCYQGAQLLWCLNISVGTLVCNLDVLSQNCPYVKMWMPVCLHVLCVWLANSPRVVPEAHFFHSMLSKCQMVE